MISTTLEHTWGANRPTANVPPTTKQQGGGSVTEEAAAVVVVGRVSVEELLNSADRLVCLGSIWHHTEGTNSTRNLNKTIVM